MRPFRFSPALPQGSPVAAGDAAILLGLVTLAYAGARLAFRTPAVIAGPRSETQLSMVAGLLEKPVEEGGRVDLSRMGSDLVLELDDLLPIVEAAGLLGFAAVEEGDLILTRSGARTPTRRFSRAKRSSRGASCAFRSSPGSTRRCKTTTISASRAITSGTSCGSISASAPPNSSTLRSRGGRHAELFAYDDDSGELYLESLPGERTEQTFALAELYEAWPVLSPREAWKASTCSVTKTRKTFFST